MVQILYLHRYPRESYIKQSQQNIVIRISWLSKQGIKLTNVTLIVVLTYHIKLY